MLQRLHPGLQRIVFNNGWTDLRDIQKAAFEDIYAGKDCVLEAPTSGGKTEAIFFPLLTRIAEEKKKGVRILYIAPLKALLNDVEIRATAYARACYLDAFKWHGDVSQGDKIQQFLFPAEVMLTTPESLEAILLRKANWKIVFQHLHAIVIDEAHAFALSDRGSHLVSLLERLEFELGFTPQRIGITATIGNPEELLQWLLGTRRIPGQHIQVKATEEKAKDFKVHYFRETDPPLNLALYDLLVNKKSIVFRNSRSHTEDTARYINERNALLRPPIPLSIRTHHSSVSKYFREQAEALIKVRTESSLHAIISTSTLELGIDIGDLDQVIQVGDLTSSGSFLQRVGRTGRRNQPQFFRGLCDDEEDLLLLTACVNLGLRKVSESILFPTHTYHILAHQVICLVLQKAGATADQIWTILSGAYCFSGISKENFRRLIENMLREDFLRKVEHDLLVTGDKTESQFLHSNWKRLFAIFETGPMYQVVSGKQIIGTLDSSFVNIVEAPFLFMLGGIEWKALKINHESQLITAEKTRTGQIPKWVVFKSSDIPFEVAQEVGHLLMQDKPYEFLDAIAQLQIDAQRAVSSTIDWHIGAWSIEYSPDGTVFIYTFSGDKINRTLGLFLKQKGNFRVHTDFRCVEAIPVDRSNLFNVEDIEEILTDAQANLTPTDLMSLIQASIKSIWFSKFSPCLPDTLAKDTILDKSLDMKGLLREVKSVTFNVSK